jgi:type IV secretion system protein TrbL
MKKLLVSSVLICLLTALFNPVHASSLGVNNADLLDSILLRFEHTASGWGKRLVELGTGLFWGLTLISMVWTYGLMALRKADIGEFLAETVRFFATTGFFLWLLRNGPQIATAIMDSCRMMASQASGLSKVVSPSGIIDIGFDIASKVVDKSSIWSPATSTVGLLIATVILVVLALVSINLLIILITGWILAYGGVFLLGFGGGRWTQDIAISYYKMVLGVGIEMFAMVLLVGIGKSFIDQYYAAMGNDMAFKELLVMLVVAIILLLLMDKIPSKLAAIVGGAGGGGGSMGSFGLGAALGAAGMASTMASSAAASSMGAATGVAGGGAALKAAFQAAQSSIGGNSSGGSSSNQSGGSLASAMGGASRMAALMGSQLGAGVAQTAKDKFDSMKEAAHARISETLGGQVAQSISDLNQGSAGENANQASQSASNDSILNFSGDSLGAGNVVSLASQNDEVAQFVNNAKPIDGGDE